jgi:hypothetical protein
LNPERANDCWDGYTGGREEGAGRREEELAENGKA